MMEGWPLRLANTEREPTERDAGDAIVRKETQTGQGGLVNGLDRVQKKNCQRLLGR